LNDLAIDPTRKGDKKKLILFLTDAIYKESCYKKDSIECKENILKFIKKKEDEIEFILDETFIKKIIEKRLIYRISQRYITSILITEELTEKQIIDIQNLKLRGLYIYEK
jgi:hypothetical protein